MYLNMYSSRICVVSFFFLWAGCDVVDSPLSNEDAQSLEYSAPFVEPEKDGLRVGDMIDRPAYDDRSIAVQIDPTLVDPDWIVSLVDGSLIRVVPLGDSVATVFVGLPEGYPVDDALGVFGSTHKLSHSGVSLTSSTAYRGRIPGVYFVERAAIYYPMLIPNDPLYATHQYSLQITNTPEAWDIEQGDPSVVVNVIDTGIDPHQEFRNRLISSWDALRGFSVSSSVGNDSIFGGHGSHVAGISSANGNDRRGMAGVAWNTALRSLRVCGDSMGCPSSATIEAVRLVADSPDAARSVINLSLGGPGYSFVAADAYAYALSRDVSIIAASGNSGDTRSNYPSGYEGVIGVGSTNSRDMVSSFSTRGSVVDIVAPGESIIAAMHDTWNGYMTISGTSMATPFVTGYAALIRSVNPYLTPSNIQEVMEVTSDPIQGKSAAFSWRSDQGFGRVNVGNGIELAENMYKNWGNADAYVWRSEDDRVHKMVDYTKSSQGFRYGNLRVRLLLDDDRVYGGKEDVPVRYQSILLMDKDEQNIVASSISSGGFSHRLSEGVINGLIEPGVSWFRNVPAGEYTVRVALDRSEDVRYPVVIEAGVDKEEDIVLGYPEELLSTTISLFPLYSDTDSDIPDPATPNWLDPYSLHANRLSALIYVIDVKQEEDGGREERAVQAVASGGVRGEGRTERESYGHYGYPVLDLLLPVSGGYVAQVISVPLALRSLYESSPWRFIGYYGISVTDDGYAPISHKISPTIDVLPKNAPGFFGSEARSTDYWWLDPEAQEWLTQKGEYRDLITGDWVDENYQHQTSPDRVALSNKDSLVIHTGYLHLGDTDYWHIDLPS